MVNILIILGTIRSFNYQGIFEQSASQGTSGGHKLMNLAVQGNFAAGVRLNSRNSMVKDCIFSGNGKSGIVCQSTTTITNCVSYDNDDYGIWAGNTCYRNTGYGIDPGANSLVIDNTAISNTAGNIDTCLLCNSDRNEDS
ncbi:MAG: hypothetical protein D3926_13640 [Desulfobacteraceae bacterium]|nr:MAG: hypothetical protein D3926_13640 [Desulfobacteraceae bacterium]